MASIWLYCENVKSEQYLKILQLYHENSRFPPSFKFWSVSTIQKHWAEVKKCILHGFQDLKALLKWQVYDYTVKMSSRNISFSPVQPNFFLQDSESKYFFDFLMTTVLFRFFCWYMGEPFWSCNLFLSIYPSSYSILILWFFS
jgi:magnesium-transporting ATPase (P-type)